MTYKVYNFPIFHRYLASILQRVGLAEGSYSDTLNTVGSYTVTGRCECGDDTCNTLHLHSNLLVGKDGTYCYGFNIGYIIFNFYKDGALHIESLADRPDFNYPFKDEIVDVLGGKKLEYDENYADSVIEEFMEKLQTVEVRRIAV